MEKIHSVMMPAQKVEHLPHKPGVYLFKDEAERIIYIGKALDLKKRVTSYFSGRLADTPKLEILRRSIKDLEIIETETEVDALLLEAHLVNRYHPKYNVRLKDDKSYPLLKITGDAFPMIQITRKKRKERTARYYGPFTDARLLREAVRIMNTIFPVRKCRTLPKKECLYYHIHQCLAPCIKPEVKSEYDGLVREINAFLAGGKKSLVTYLTERMFKASAEQRYEEAQIFKEQIQALSVLKRKRFDIRRPTRGIALSGMLELKRVLKLKRVPERIVCFDVSNLKGGWAVASKVSFHHELPDKAEYRRYRIRTVSGIDDYAMIREAVGRMIRGLREGREVFIPDLIVIDGGLGHLHAAEEVLTREGFTEADLISLAKRFEEIFTLQQPGPVRLEETSPALRLLQKVRDEAHRFAITYHKLLRGKAVTASLLDKVPGIGPKRKQLILSYLDRPDALLTLTEEELRRMPDVGPKTAAAIRKALNADADATGKN